MSVDNMERKSTKSSVRYQKLARADDGFIDMQFERPPPKIPYKAIILASVLFIVGSLLIIIGALLLAGIVVDAKYADRTWPVLILGALMFIPGAYHVHIAYSAWKGHRGYSFSDIPEFE